jgi:hypothetical protein
VPTTQAGECSVWHKGTQPVPTLLTCHCPPTYNRWTSSCALPPSFLPPSLPLTDVIHEPLDVAPPVANGGADVEVQLLRAPAVQGRYRGRGKRCMSSMGWQQGGAEMGSGEWVGGSWKT